MGHRIIISTTLRVIASLDLWHHGSLCHQIYNTTGHCIMRSTASRVIGATAPTAPYTTRYALHQYVTPYTTRCALRLTPHVAPYALHHTLRLTPYTTRCALHMLRLTRCQTAMLCAVAPPQNSIPSPRNTLVVIADVE